MGQEKKPDWLEMSRVLKCLGLDEQRQVWSQSYKAYIKKCCNEWATEHGRKEMSGEWDALRRKWCLGDNAFREKLLESVGGQLKGKQRETYGGEEKLAHDERAAFALLAKGLAGLGLSIEKLSVLRKGDKRKQALGWWLSRHTCVGADWISDHLIMGHRTYVSKAARLIEGGKDIELNLLRRKLEKIPRFSD